MSDIPTSARMIPRSKRLRALSYMLAFMVALYWGSWLFPFTAEMVARKQQIDASTFALSLVYTGYFIVVCGGLYLGHGWGWWAAVIGVFAPALLVGIKYVVFLDALGGLTLIFLLQAFHATHPWLERLSPDLVNDIDAIAQSLGLRWDEQPLWQLVQQAQAGQATEAVKQYRDTHVVSWDEADHAIKRWIGNEAELKVHLLKEWVVKSKT